jgi:hypothetical protein
MAPAASGRERRPEGCLLSPGAPGARRCSGGADEDAVGSSVASDSKDGIVISYGGLRRSRRRAGPTLIVGLHSLMTGAVKAISGRMAGAEIHVVKADLRDVNKQFDYLCASSFACVQLSRD